MAKCDKCGCKVFFVDEITTHLEVDGEIGRQLGDDDFNNRNNVKCVYPELYEDYKKFNEQ